ncbi:MAG: acyl-CoA dehydrogenase family protein [Pseudomonadota bacterium]
MNFDLSPEQQMLADSVEKFVSDEYDLERRTQASKMRGGFAAERWQQMAELGWLSLNVPAEAGGFGGNQVDTMLVMEQFGKGLVLEPYLAHAVLGLGTLLRAPARSRRDALIEQAMTGATQLAFAHAETQSRFDLDNLLTRASADGPGFELNGQKSMVINGGSADTFIVAARTSGAQIDTAGISLFLVDRDTEGLKVQGFPTVDGLQAAELTFEGVKLDETALLSPLDAGWPLLLAAAMDGMLALGAEAVGAMERLYKDTVTYTSEREQFDHPLAEFQVLQHRMVDMFVEYEQCKSLLYRATLEVATQGNAALRTVHALKHYVGKAGIMIGENAVQLHGGMGMTEELPIGHYFKRLLVIDAQFGNSDYHLQKFAEYSQ